MSESTTTPNAISEHQAKVAKIMELAAFAGWKNIQPPGSHDQNGNLQYKATGIDPHTGLFGILPDYFEDVNAALDLGDRIAGVGCRDEWIITILARIEENRGMVIDEYDQEFWLLQASAEDRAESALIVFRELKARLSQAIYRHAPDAQE